MRRPRFFHVIIGLATLLILGWTTTALSTELRDARLDTCFVGGPNKVLAAFEIPSGEDYHSMLPAMGISPELEGVSGAFVVVYDGPAQIPVSGMPGTARPQALQNAVCVVLPSGERIVYQNVSRAGLRTP